MAKEELTPVERAEQDIEELRYRQDLLGLNLLRPTPLGPAERAAVLRNIDQLKDLKVDMIVKHGVIDEFIDRFIKERARLMKTVAKLDAKIARLKAARTTN